MPKAAKSKAVGRPSSYTQDVADSICEHIATGHSLVSWCEETGRPSYATVARWLQVHANFRDSYARARESQADFLAEEIIQIANTPIVGVKTKTNEKGEVETIEGDMIEHRRLQVDARKWYAAKLRPKVYGDRIQQEHSGEVAITGMAARIRERAAKVKSE